MLPTKFRYIWPNSFRGEEYLKSANQKQESPMVAMFVNDWDEMRAFHRCFLPSFSSFGWGVLEAYLSVIQFIANCILLISIFKIELSPFPQKNCFFLIKHTIINMNCLWRPCLLMDRDEMSNIYRGPSIDVSYQVSVHLAQWFQRRRLKKIGQSETRIACGGHVC
jgi:hypothetical protein